MLLLRFTSRGGCVVVVFVVLVVVLVAKAKVNGEVRVLVVRLLIPAVRFWHGVRDVLRFFLAHPKSYFWRNFRENDGKTTRLQTLVENIGRTKRVVFHASSRNRDEEDPCFFSQHFCHSKQHFT